MSARQDAFSPENPPTDDVMTPENQQLIPAAGSFYDECIPMKGYVHFFVSTQHPHNIPTIYCR
jgi:hypothetical protein